MEKKDFNEAAILYNEDGFVILKGMIEKEIISQLLSEVEKVKVSPKLNHKRDLHYVNENEISSMHNIADYSEYYKNFIRNSKVSEFFKNVYGEAKDVIFNSSYFAKPKDLEFLQSPIKKMLFSV